MGLAIVDAVQGSLARCWHGLTHVYSTLHLKIRRSVLARRTLVAFSITALLGVVTTPLGAMRLLLPAGAGAALLGVGVLAWLTVALCHRNGWRVVARGLLLVGMLAALAGAALIGNARLHLSHVAALATLAISIIGGLVCLFVLAEITSAQRAAAHERRISGLQLAEGVFALVILGIFLLRVGDASLLTDPRAFTLVRFTPITLGVVTAWSLIDHIRQQTAACMDMAQGIGWLGLALQVFLVLSPAPFTLGWTIALALLGAQMLGLHLWQQHRLVEAVDAARAEVVAQQRRLHAWQRQHAEHDKQRAALLALGAHDAKAPLHLITLLASQIAHVTTAETPDPLLPEYARRLYSSSLRLSRFMDLFLDFAGQQVDAPMALKLERVAPVEIVQGIIADERALAGGPLHLELTPPADVHGLALDEGVTAQWDKARIEAVVVNLLSNALKFSRNTPVTVRLWQPDAEHIALDVADRGRGMSRAALDHIFEPYYRAENAQATRGHGLGLAMVKLVVERHGGTIAVQSALGQGTLVRVTLPRESRRAVETAP
jgi:signal transduction histidine kinase